VAHKLKTSPSHPLITRIKILNFLSLQSEPLLSVTQRHVIFEF
jgi:hypothetical protein